MHTSAKRVVFLTEFPSALGGEHALATLIRALDPTRYKAVVVGPSGGDLETLIQKTGVDFVRLPDAWRHGQSETRAQFLCRTLLALEPDLIHANSLMTSTHVGWFAGQGIPCAGHVRDIMRLSHAQAERLNRMDALFAVSQATFRNLCNYGVSPQRVHVLYDGIDADEVWNPERIPCGQLRNELGLAPDALLVGCLGQIGIRKDPLCLVRAAASLADQFPVLHLVIVGQRFSNSPEAADLESACRTAALPLGHRAHFLPYRRDARSLIRDLDILVNCSRQEPCGRTIIEAQALARAVVATAVGGSPEIVQHGITGLLVPPADPTALSEALATLLVNPSLRRAMGAAARSWVRDHLSVAQYVKGVTTVYEALLTGSAL